MPFCLFTNVPLYEHAICKLSKCIDRRIIKRNEILAAVGFEPTPPKRLVPKTSALDRSATLPGEDRTLYQKLLFNIPNALFVPVNCFILHVANNADPDEMPCRILQHFVLSLAIVSSNLHKWLRSAEQRDHQISGKEISLNHTWLNLVHFHNNFTEVFIMMTFT